MLKKIHTPWGTGLGTLGFTFTNRYVDFSLRKTFRDGKMRTVVAKFVANYDKEGNPNQRSWYSLTKEGWKLTKREDRFGEWMDGRRRPALLERPADIGQRAWELRKEFRPFQMIDWYGQQKEVISFPSPEKNSVNLMIRNLNDPTTLEEVVLEHYC